MKKKLWLIAFLGTAAIALAACGVAAQGASSSESGNGNSNSSSSTVVNCNHKMSNVRGVTPTCARSGNMDCWVCLECKNYYLDEAGTQQTSREEILLDKLPHEGNYHEATAASCEQIGNIAYYDCTMCNKYFEDVACTVVLSEEEVYLPKTDHAYTHYEGVYGKGWEVGVAEHWYCDTCEGYYLDEAGETKVAQADLTLAAPFSIPDFVVEVSEHKTPVVLQITDTQLIDASQVRPGRDGVSLSWTGPDKVWDRCYKYLTELFNATKPDLIILTGDIIYGEFDDNGSMLTSFVNFMESFQIPWAPIFGNHDNETKMGVDWQCQQFEKAEYCLFEQRELTGNGNYSVAIAQGGVITRAFYMMDSNGLGNPSEESLANGHTTREVGFGYDQIAWYQEQIGELKKSVPEVKISFAYHIQTAVFGKAYEKYGFDPSSTSHDINIDTLSDKADGDIGYIGGGIKGAWDASYAVYRTMKALGVDSVFVGHEHNISASVVYEGIRFQFGQKSSEYDFFNSIDAQGNIHWGDTPVGTSLVGGTVIPLSEDGSIDEPYIYYCGFENGKIDWNSYKK